MGATTYAPGQRGSVFISFTMHEGMEGFHHFEIEIKSNDPVEPVKILTVKADFIKTGG